MIPSGNNDHDHAARAQASAHRSARTADVESSRQAAEAALQKLLDSWRSDAYPGSVESAHRWDGEVMDAIDALSALLAAVDLAGSGPLLINQRARS